MKNIFKMTLLAGALTLPQAGGSAWGQQIDFGNFTMEGISFQGATPTNSPNLSRNLFENGWSGTGTTTMDSPHFENGNYDMGDMFDAVKKSAKKIAYEEVLGFQAAGYEILAFMDTLAEAYEPVGHAKDSHTIDNLVHTVHGGTAGNQHFNAANAVDLFNNKYGADAVEAIQDVNTMEALEQFGGLFSKAPLSWGVQKTQFEGALEQIEAFKGTVQLQEQLRQLEQTTFSGNKNFAQLLPAKAGSS